MFSHIFTGVGDFDRAFAFYAPLLQALGLTLRFCEPDTPWAGWQLPDRTRPLFLIGHAFNGQAHAPGNGQMVAFLADTRAQVDAVYALAIQHGARCDGPPGPRPHYHPDYYGAYFRDPDGNKIGLACHHAY